VQETHKLPQKSLLL